MARRADDAAIPPLGETLEFMRLLWAINHGLELASTRMLGSLGVTGVQRLVIRVVGKFPGITAGQVADILHLDPSTLTPVLHKLMERRLLERRSDPRDARRSVLGLTAKGRALDKPAAGTVEAAVEATLHKLQPSKLQTAVEILSALARALHEGGQTGAAR